MYIRFITPWWQVRRGVHYGLFGPAYDCARDMDVPEVLRAALWEEIGWFNANLPVPRRGCFLVKSRKRWRSDGICWFVDDAREMIAHAFVMAWLLRECGVPVTKVATHRPGQILYRDDYQIVAKPEAATPTTWH
ncbi:hypothetical protein IC614_07630 [Allosphingosinicella flava]|uniref:Uncharacterized protein n=1 Tax=Allosphingosinicella flava TaxID=2771430 RepID=A0A7T2LLA7_9SPHN|nr:hypothetical protein [Sphingosinicella flava]QPQ54234.1 hypothetical protein IC614_07630 [Sphingosinicella flava]